jgi:hypothetical protein
LAGLSETKSGHRKDTAKRKAPGERDLGAALRTVYDRTVEESVPSDLLDLLGKLD